MNHKDKKSCFKREIEIFDNVIVKLAELYKNGGVIIEPDAKERVKYNTSALSDKEGGYLERR